MEKQLALPRIGKLLFRPSFMNEYRELQLGLYEHRTRKFGEFVTQNDFEWSSRMLYPKALRGVGIEFGMAAHVEHPLENIVCEGSEYYHGIRPKIPFDTKEVYIELVPKERVTLKERIFTFRIGYNNEDTLKVTHHLCTSWDFEHLDDRIQYEKHHRSKKLKDPAYWEGERARIEQHNKEFRMALKLPVNEPSIVDMTAYPYESLGDVGGLDLGEANMRAFFAQNLPKFRFSRSWLSKRLPNVLYAEEKSEFAGVIAKAAELYSLGKDGVSDAVGSVENPADFEAV